MPKYRNIKNGMIKTMTEVEFNKLPKLLKSKYSLQKEETKSKPAKAEVKKPEDKA